MRLPNGRYNLNARGAPTGIINNLLYAFPIDTEKAEDWIITRREDDGHERGQFTRVILGIIRKPNSERNVSRSIEKADKTVGWVVQTYEGEAQV